MHLRDLARSLAALGVPLVVAGAITGLGSVPASATPIVIDTLVEHWDGTSWSQVASPSPSNSTNFINGVAAVSGNDVWAVGEASDSSGDTNLIEHWDGSAWTVQPNVPAPSKSARLAAVSADSATDAWAIGQFVGDQGSGIDEQSEVLHWDGTSWTQVSFPNPTVNTVFDVHAVSPSDAWAVGFASDGRGSGTSRNLILHWDGISWSEVPNVPSVPGDGNGLFGVTATSATDAWAVGSHDTLNDPTGDKSAILHWDGSTWTAVANLPNPGPDNVLGKVSADPSGNDAWAVGKVFGSDGNNHPFFLHWDGYAWTQVPSVDPASAVSVVNDVQTFSPTDAWAAGESFSTSGPNTTLLEHWDGTSWSQVASANPGVSNGIAALAAVSPTDVWAVGSTEPPFTVPNVLLWNEAPATARIQAEGLVVSVNRLTTTSQCSPSQEGKVVTTNPLPTTAVSAGSTVTISVCHLPQFPVPNVVGESTIMAQDSMRVFGFVPVTSVVTCQPGGTVQSTDPPAHTVLPQGTTVVLHVCRVT
jgi:hypothetical protein